jgi:hypothetical protein
MNQKYLRDRGHIPFWDIIMVLSYKNQEKSVKTSQKPPRFELSTSWMQIKHVGTVPLTLKSHYVISSLMVKLLEKVATDP